jgi:hypothetical protein
MGVLLPVLPALRLLAPSLPGAEDSMEKMCTLWGHAYRFALLCHMQHADLCLLLV